MMTVSREIPFFLPTENRIVLPSCLFAIAVLYAYYIYGGSGELVHCLSLKTNILAKLFFYKWGNYLQNLTFCQRRLKTLSNDKKLLQPQAKSSMDNLKLKVANEMLSQEVGKKITEENYQEILDKKKYEVAEDLGLKEKIENVGWENMTTKEVGTIGGRLGGKIGGNMVKELITMAESQMAPVAPEANINEQALKAYGKSTTSTGTAK
jgi:hypothetical protein